jgi:hypothetical protein
MRGDDPRSLARDGLVGLGFSLQEAERLLASASGETPEELIEGAREPRRLHVIRVCSEASVTPGGIVRILARFSASAQLGRVRVTNSSGRQRCCEVRSVEMRVSPRCRKGAHIY